MPTAQENYASSATRNGGVLGDFMAVSGMADRLFVSNKLWATGDFLADAGASERSLALDRGIAVAAAMPFEKARLFQVVGARPAPAFAREIGIQSWADYFLKWVVSHPAILATYPATANPDHATQNVAALRGTLPDAAMRNRMLRFMETIPGFDGLEQTPWYSGKRYPGVIARATADRDARLKAPR